MAAGLFDFAAEQLERHTDFDRLEARGTLRITLKEAGLNPKALTVDQMRVVFERLIPGQLQSRGVEECESVCSALITALASCPAEANATESSDDIFSRLGGD